jgi:hypothetical protein
MPNPDRPQYQDTIEETWGQAVADTVVRRYTSSADRDADLAAFTPAELMGQVVVIAPGAGALAYLQQHDGAAWHTVAEPIIAGKVLQTASIGGTGTWTKIACPAVDYLRGGCAADGQGNLKVPIAGRYDVAAGIGTMNGAGNSGVTGQFTVNLGRSITNPLNYLFEPRTVSANTNPSASVFAPGVLLEAGETVGLGCAFPAGWYCDPASGWQLPSWISVRRVGD